MIEIDSTPKNPEKVNKKLTLNLVTKRNRRD